MGMSRPFDLVGDRFVGATLARALSVLHVPFRAKPFPRVLSIEWGGGLLMRQAVLPAIG